MRRNPVDSTGVASIGYDSASRELEIQFRQSREIYRYFDVPPDEYLQLINADSIGTYLNKVFKPRGYRYVVVSKVLDRERAVGRAATISNSTISRPAQLKTGRAAAQSGAEILI